MKYSGCKVYQFKEEESGEYDFFPRRRAHGFEFTGYMDIETLDGIDHKEGDKLWINKRTYVII